jgi:hypothetical protein
MTGKEIIRALLRGERVPRLAWVPLIDPYTRSGFSEPLRSMEVFELQRHFGADLYRGCSGEEVRYDSAIKHVRTEWGDGGILDVYETPKGRLREVHTFNAASPYIPFPTEPLIKNWEDLDAYLCLVEHSDVFASHGKCEDVIRRQPEAMISAAMPDTPLAMLMTKLIGVETFVYMHMEDPDRMKTAMERMQSKNVERCRAAAAGPCELFISYENTNTTCFGVRWIEEYELPCLNEYADVCHAAGKHLLVHMCGHIETVVARIAESRIDGVIDVAPPPTGDCRIPGAASTLAARGKLFGGGIECNTFLLKDADLFERHVRDLVDSIPDTSSFLLGSGDAVPQGTTEENLHRARRIAHGA